MQNALNPIKSYKLKLPAIEIAISEWGDETGTPIIALHGWLDNMASFYPLIDTVDWLTENKMRLITVDWAGHGHSGHRHASNAYYLLDYVQDLSDLIDELGLSKVNILAHSLGGSIATLYAGSFPDRVNKLMLIEAMGPMTLNEEEGPKQLAKSIIQRAKNQTREHAFYQDLDLVFQARKQGTELSEKNVAMLVGRNMKSTDKGYQWRSDPRLRLPSQMMLTPGQSEAFIKNLSMPVVLLYGEEGFVKKYPQLSNAVNKYHHISKISLKGGHHLHMEHPVLVRNEIIRFMSN